MEDVKDFQMLGHEHMIAMFNHKYDVDWLMSWVFAERLALLGVSTRYAQAPIFLVEYIISKFIPQ